MLLTDDFIGRYEKEVPFDDLGEFVFYRTYSRWNEEKGRRETWPEVCRRALEYNMSLGIEREPKSKLPAYREEMEKLFDNVFNLRQFCSGRTLWIGGTPASEKHSISHFNCAALIINKPKSFSDLFYLLMVGAGVGFRILKTDVEKLPRFRTDLVINHIHNQNIKRPFRKEFTEYEISDNKMCITVGDSKEGKRQLPALCKLGEPINIGCAVNVLGVAVTGN